MRENEKNVLEGERETESGREKAEKVTTEQLTTTLCILYTALN